VLNDSLRGVRPEWIASWNSHDIERICRTTKNPSNHVASAAKIAASGGRITGKEAARSIGPGLAKRPTFTFSPSLYSREFRASFSLQRLGAALCRVLCLRHQRQGCLLHAQWRVAHTPTLPLRRHAMAGQVCSLRQVGCAVQSSLHRSKTSRQLMTHDTRKYFSRLQAGSSARDRLSGGLARSGAARSSLVMNCSCACGARAAACAGSGDHHAACRNQALEAAAHTPSDLREQLDKSISSGTRKRLVRCFCHGRQHLFQLLDLLRSEQAQRQTLNRRCLLSVSAEARLWNHSTSEARRPSLALSVSVEGPPCRREGTLANRHLTLRSNVELRMNRVFPSSSSQTIPSAAADS